MKCSLVCACALFCLAVIMVEDGWHLLKALVRSCVVVQVLVLVLVRAFWPIWLKLGNSGLLQPEA